jgi:hypothetical protein
MDETNVAPRARSLSLADYGPAADGVADDTPALRRCFTDAQQAGGAVITIPPGAYRVTGEKPVPIPSHTTVLAHGARFLLPDSLGEGARRVVFAGQDVQDFHWRGGEFAGHCFDHRRPGNTWAPNANTRILWITTSPGGATDLLTFADIQASRIAGAVVTVEGVKASESAAHTHATRVSVQRCALRECGKFMWDYGLLWQILTWPGEYAPADVELARRYFRNDLARGPLRMDDGGDRVYLDNARAGIAVSAGADNDEAVSFFGGVLPANVARGRKYYVVSSAPDHVRISESVQGPPIVFSGAAGPGVFCMTRLHQAYYHLYAPSGAGPGKGGIDLVACRDARVTGCDLSALGDTMHIQCSRDIVFANNQITGSRMGAFFLAEHNVNAVVTGNTVDGTNGSRVMSVERSCTDVVITGNTFRNGGRGSWINQPQRIILSDNIFVNNTTKGERDPWRGRKLLETGDYGAWPEVYFTIYEPDGRYGPAIVRNNLFVTGPECSDAIAFQRGGHDLLLDGNVFEGGARTVRVDAGCEPPRGGNNLGLAEMRAGEPGGVK